MTKFGPGSHLHLIDGSAFIFRAFHALPPLRRRGDGLPVGAVSGFCNMLRSHLTGIKRAEDNAPTHLAVIFDHRGQTFRHSIFDQYKANRGPRPDDLIPQIPLTREATEAFGVASAEVEGFEADDIIATLAFQTRDAGGQATIVSSDKDLMQLVGDSVEMLDPMTGERIGRRDVVRKFGVRPERVVDVQALAGDSVDNVPGAPGIGVKTAAALINEYGTLEALLSRARSVKQPKRRGTLIEFREQIEMSKQLVQLDCCVPLDFTLDDLALRQPVAETLFAFFERMEFRTLAKRCAIDMELADPTATWEHVDDPAAQCSDPLEPWRCWCAGDTSLVWDGCPPRPGFYKRRFVKNGPWVPIHIHLTDADGGDALSAEENGWPKTAEEVWLDWTYLRPIAREEYDALVENHRTDHRMAATHAAIDLTEEPVRP